MKRTKKTYTIEMPKTAYEQIKRDAKAQSKKAGQTITMGTVVRQYVEAIRALRETQPGTPAGAA